MTSQRMRDKLVAQLGKQPLMDPRVLELIRYTPRHLFMDEAMASRAYDNASWPIGEGQTISQPEMVALMTSLALTVPKLDKVLEIGTGSGYQTALLAQVARQVYTVERIGKLQQKAQSVLAGLQYRNVRFRVGDGYQGWKEMGPYHAILVTAAPPKLPEILLSQLAEGGRLIIPIGEAKAQKLYMITRQGEKFLTHQVCDAAFVPLVEGIKT
jgi:protein-L-isoaspartate(D-aspartate) O-methyltransferase